MVVVVVGARGLAEEGNYLQDTKERMKLFYKMLEWIVQARSDARMRVATVSLLRVVEQDGRRRRKQAKSRGRSRKYFLHINQQHATTISCPPMSLSTPAIIGSCKVWLSSLLFLQHYDHCR